MRISALQIVGFVLISGTIISSIYLLTNKIIRNIIRRYWHWLIIIFFACLLSQFPYNKRFYDGLEYEDSYIYKASARSIYLGNYKYSEINPFFPTSCSYGSLNNCHLPGIHVTNYLGYPYIISRAYHLFGYHTYTSNILSLMFSALSVILLFCCALLVINKLPYALICCFVYITIPIFNVYASTSLTEPLSNYFLLLTTLIAFLVLTKMDDVGHLAKLDWLGYISLGLSLLMAILIRTSNMSLIFCLVLIGLINSDMLASRNKKVQWQQLIPITVIALVIYYICLFVLRFQTAVELNQSDIGTSPYSIKYFLILAPIYIKSLFRVDWYLIYSVLFLAGIVIGLRRKLGIYLIAIFIAVFVLHAAHYRSYGFTRGLTVHGNEYIRYMISVISIYALLVGIGIYSVYRYVKKHIRIPIYKYMATTLLIASALGVGAISYALTEKNRKYFIEDEYNSRLSGVYESLEYIDSNTDILIAADHILYQIWGPADLRIIEMAVIGGEVSTNDLDEIINSNVVLYMKKSGIEDMDRDRYKTQYEYIDSKGKELIARGNRWELFRLKGKTNKEKT